MADIEREPVDDGFEKITTPEDDLDEVDLLSGEAELEPAEVPVEELAGDDDYDAIDEVVAEDPKDL
jgi:hypothetical protein